MINEERWEEIQRKQPPFAAVISETAKDEYDWLQGNNDDYSEAEQKRFHEKLERTGIRSQVRHSKTTLLEDLFYLAKRAM